MPARSPQLLHPLAPALACPCRTSRDPLVGGRPSCVVYRVRCAQPAAGVRVSCRCTQHWWSEEVGAPRAAGWCTLYLITNAGRKSHPPHHLKIPDALRVYLTCLRHVCGAAGPPRGDAPPRPRLAGCGLGASARSRACTQYGLRLYRVLFRPPEQCVLSKLECAWKLNQRDPRCVVWIVARDARLARALTRGTRSRAWLGSTVPWTWWPRGAVPGVRAASWCIMWCMAAAPGGAPGTGPAPASGARGGASRTSSAHIRRTARPAARRVAATSRGSSRAT